MALDSTTETQYGGQVRDLDGRVVTKSGDSAANIFRRISTASTNAAVVKASAGKVFGWTVNNVNAAVRYLKLYDKASAPTVGTDVPVLTIAIPAASVQNISFPRGLTFATGIAMALTTGVADTDTAAVAANEQVVHIYHV